MKRSHNTVLVTGGSSGIGLELSKVLVQRGNKVIICGSTEHKLKAAKTIEPKLITYVCDLSDRDSCLRLATTLKEKHPDLNVLINNAATVHTFDLIQEEHALEYAEKEYQTNLIAPIRLIKMLYSTLQANDSPVIINVTTGLIYAPRARYPFYNSSKAGLHSFTQTLRYQLRNKKIEVLEVMFPAVATPWHKGNPPKIAIGTEKAVEEMLKGIDRGRLEIRIGGAKLLYHVSRIAPGFAFKKVNQIE
jgi:uncharacterized oxidoreductase